jgi:hypothetical protein
VDDDFVAGGGDLDLPFALGARAGLAGVLVADLEAGVTTGADDVNGHGGYRMLDTGCLILDK